MSTPTTAPTPTLSPPRYSWETTPLPLQPTPRALSTSPSLKPDQYTLVASDMALVHNCLSRALNSIYLQAPYIPPSEHANFTQYAIAAHIGLKAHHDGEENVFFPELEKMTGEKGLMDANIGQHADFHAGFEEWGTWLYGVRDGKEKFDGNKCVALLDKFLPALGQHLADEIPTLISLSRFGDKVDMLKLAEAEGRQVMGGLSKTRELPVFWANHDVDFEEGIHTEFPPVPAPVRWVLREVFGRWNAAWWKFGTCGFDGRPRELAFLGEEKKQ